MPWLKPILLHEMRTKFPNMIDIEEVWFPGGHAVCNFLILPYFTGI